MFYFELLFSYDLIWIIIKFNFQLMIQLNLNHLMLLIFTSYYPQLIFMLTLVAIISSLLFPFHFLFFILKQFNLFLTFLPATIVS